MNGRVRKKSPPRFARSAVEGARARADSLTAEKRRVIARKARTIAQTNTERVHKPGQARNHEMAH